MNSFSQRLRHNRQSLGIPDPVDHLILHQEGVSAILQEAIQLLDLIDPLNLQSLLIELGAIKNQAEKLEQAIIQAISEATDSAV